MTRIQPASPRSHASRTGRAGCSDRLRQSDRVDALPRTRRSGQRGFSLVELMIALVLTGFVILVVVSLYQNARETYTHQDALARLQENVRIGMGLVERTIRQGNYKRIPAARDQNPLLVEAFSFQQLRGGDGGEEGSDWIQITYHGSNRLPPDPDEPADGAIVDCLGQGVPADVASNNRFEIKTADDGRRWLSCSRPGSDAPGSIALIPDVEALEILYGIYADESRTVTNFVPWSSSVEPSRVVAIRIGMLFRSSEPIAPAPSSATYELGGQTLGPFNDRFIRMPVESTIVIRSTAM